MPFTRPASVDDALARLREGNLRFVEERPQATVHSALRVELASGQDPFAVVLGCSDSRVPIETLFDQQPGNLFVARVAGNVVSEDVLGSIEYAVELLDVQLVVVLGHSACGAVQAAIQAIEFGTTYKDHIQWLVDAVVPPVRAARERKGDWLHDAVAGNVRHSADAILERSGIVRSAAERGSVRVEGAVYDLHSGRVTFDV